MNLKRVYPFWHFDAKALLYLFVMEDTPKIHSVILINCRIEIPTSYILKDDWSVRTLISGFEAGDLVEFEEFHVTFLRIETKLILVI
jgi:hypothetical protein